MTRPTTDAPCVILNRRMIDAPRERVFQAFTNPQVLARWWGPKGFANTFHRCEVRPGGEWHFTMHAPNGMEFPNRCLFDDVTAPERIVIHHIEPMHDFTLTITLEEAQGATWLVWHMRFTSAEECARVREFVQVANEENLDRLEAQLT